MHRISLTRPCMSMISVGMIPTSTYGIQAMALGQHGSRPGMLLACYTATEDRVCLTRRPRLSTCKMARTFKLLNTRQPWRRLIRIWKPDRSLSMCLVFPARWLETLSRLGMARSKPRPMSHIQPLTQNYIRRRSTYVQIEDDRFQAGTSSTVKFWEDKLVADNAIRAPTTRTGESLLERSWYSLLKNFLAL